MKNVYFSYCLPAITKFTPTAFGRTLLLMVLLLSALYSNAQSIKVTGTVKDDTGDPLFGVTVAVKGTGVATVINQAGTYSISAASSNAVLVFSSIGYVTQEITIGSQTIINVTLKTQQNSLNEVVIIGYGAAKKKDLVGSYSSVNMADLDKAPVSTFDQALAGRVAGLVVSSNDGQPGSIGNFTIRGAGSITQDTNPLFIVDGFPLENADPNAINPQDIESIEVLKDAAATAIYGSRGANGVIVITTKRGKKGAAVVTFNYYYAIQNDPKTIPLMDTYNFVKYQNDLSPTNAAVNYFANGVTLASYLNAPSTRLSDSYIKNSPEQNYSLAIRGGNDDTQYSLSGNLFKDIGMLTNTGFTRGEGRFVIDQKINKAIKVGVNVNYSKVNGYGGLVGASYNNATTLSAFYNIWGWRPTQGPAGTPQFDPTVDISDAGTNGTATSPTNDYARFNPIINAQNTLNNNYVTDLIANAYLQVTITPHLMFKSTGGITGISGENDSFYNSNTFFGDITTYGKGPNGTITNSYNNTWINENTLTYSNVFRQVHTLNVVAGFSASQNRTKSYGFSASMLPNESEGLDGLDEAPAGFQSVGASMSSRNSLASFYTRADYNYASKYYINATFRADGSSKFVDHWGYFPSAGVAWRVTNEDFMKNVTVVNDLKIRGTWGLTGNNRVPDFANTAQFSFPTSIGYDFDNGNNLGAAVATIGNPALKWETSAQTDLGLDLSLLKSRIQFTFDAYRKTTSNLLLNANIPNTTGFSTAYINVGKIQNEGLEFTLNTVNIQSPSFSWSTNFNISFNANKVLALTSGASNLNTGVGWDGNYGANPAYIAQVGQPVSQFYGLVFNGIYQYSDFDKGPGGTYTLKPGVVGNGSATVQPGDIKYKDINGDGVINNKDFTVIGNALPIHTGGFSNNFTYKGFDLNVFFQWSYGNDLEDANRLIFEGNGKSIIGLNQWASYEDRWEPNNPSNTLPRAGGQGLTYYSSRVIEDGSYLRLKTVSLGYNIPSKYLNKIMVKAIRIYVSGQNLWTWTNYQGPDPEVSSRNSTLTQGFDYAAYPHARVTTIGINVTF